MILEQKLNQSLKLSQSMKMSLNILEMSMLNLNNFIKNEFSNKFGDEGNYSKQETYNADDRLECSVPKEEENFFQISLLMRKLRASKICALAMISAPARSAIVRASFSVLFTPRCERS